MKKVLLILFLAVVAVNARWSIYQSKAEHDHDHGEELDWWQHGVYYQIYPKSFKDNNGDGIGDLLGITEKLDHLKDLGVTGAWLSPIFLSPMVDGGYDIQDFKQVNPMFGTNEQLKALFAKAKQLGIKIILDFVPNHTSNLHDWFLLSRNRTSGFENHYVWRNCSLKNEADGEDGERVLPNNWIAVFHTAAWTYDKERKQCYLHQFTPEQPDLNYENPLVYNAMIEILKYWLEQEADGFRIDAINHMFETEGLPDEEYIDPEGDKTKYDNLRHTHTMNKPKSYQFIYDVRAMMDDFAKKDNITRFMMTEAYASVPEQAKWYGESATKRGSHMPFNFELISNLNQDSKASHFKAAIDSWMKEMPEYGDANWVLGNHDRHRVGTRYGSDRIESLAIMTMMLPGLNVVYYGEEIGMVNNWNISFAESDDPQAKQTNESYYMEVTRDPVRTPFQWDDTKWAGFSEAAEKTWLPVHENFRTLNLKAQKAAEKSTFKLYQALIKLRKENHVLQQGKLKTETISTDVFAFMRTMDDHHSVAVFVNLGEATNVTLKDLIKDDFSGNTEAKILIVDNKSELKIGEMIENVETISLGKYGAIVLEVSSAGKLAVSLILVFVSIVKFIF